MTRNLAALNINFDSLRTIAAVTAPGFQKFENDPCFYAILDRFLELANTYKLPLTAYLVGRDMEVDSLARRAQLLKSGGHECGNHTYSHLNNLGSLPLDSIREEIGRGHRAISAAMGTEPTGFIAPGWATGRRVVKTLIERGYGYDTSLFPSPLMPIFQGKLKFTSEPQYRNRFQLVRDDLVGNFIGHRGPFRATEARPWGPSKSSRHESILCLPLPTIGYRFPIWHSWAFPIGLKRYARWLRRAIKENAYFYLLVHPADLWDPDHDTRGLPDSILRFERISVSLAVKMELMRTALDVMSSECEMTTMSRIAESHDTNPLQ